MNKINYVWILVSIVCFMLGACESNEKNSTKDNASDTNSSMTNAIVGEWYCDYREGGIWWKFNSDGTFKREDEYDIEYGKYSIYCGQEEARGTFSIKDDKLITVHASTDGDNCGTQIYQIAIRNNKLFIDNMEYYRFYDD